MRIIGAALGITAMLAFASCSKNDNESMNNSDREFMERMSYANNGEVELGNMAASKGDNASIRSFGQMMSSDHGTAQSELQTLASARNYKLPVNPDVSHIALKTLLDTKSGRNFDSTYIKEQVKDHITAMEIIDNELNKGKDAGLKDYARKYRPKVEMHKSTADGIVIAMGLQ